MPGHRASNHTPRGEQVVEMTSADGERDVTLRDSAAIVTAVECRVRRTLVHVTATTSRPIYTCCVTLLRTSTARQRYLCRSHIAPLARCDE